jgi:hypothetical protein
MARNSFKSYSYKSSTPRSSQSTYGGGKRSTFTSQHMRMSSSGKISTVRSHSKSGSSSFKGWFSIFK